MMSAHTLYASGKHGVPILHDTNLDITVDRIKHAPNLRQSGTDSVPVQCCKSKYIEFGFGSRILAQFGFGFGSRSGSECWAML